MMDLFLTNTEFFTLIDVKVIWWTGLLHLHFTFMHLADAFIQSDLQLHSGYTFSLVNAFPGNRTHNLLRCWHNALPLSHRNTVIVMFWSSVWTLNLTAPIHCRASIAEQVMELHISVLMKKQTHLYLGWPFSANLYFGVSLTFKVQWAMLHTFFKLYLWHFSPIICWKTSTIWNNAVLKKQTTNHRPPQWMAN